jgi:hypothetical protein
LKFPHISNAISISCDCVFERLNDPFIKGSWVESIKEAMKEYKK